MGGDALPGTARHHQSPTSGETFIPNRFPAPGPTFRQDWPLGGPQSSPSSTNGFLVMGTPSPTPPYARNPNHAAGLVTVTSALGMTHRLPLSRETISAPIPLPRACPSSSPAQRLAYAALPRRILQNDNEPPARENCPPVASFASVSRSSNAKPESRNALDRYLTMTAVSIPGATDGSEPQSKTEPSRAVSLSERSQEFEATLGAVGSLGWFVAVTTDGDGAALSSTIRGADWTGGGFDGPKGPGFSGTSSP